MAALGGRACLSLTGNFVRTPARSTKMPKDIFSIFQRTTRD